MAYFRCTGNSGGSLKLRTAQGEIASFETNLPEPYPSLTVNVLATGGNGTPDNPNPIVGYSSANIVNTQNDSIVDLFSIDSDFRGTVEFNQLVQNGNFADTSVWSPYNLNFSVNNNIGTFIAIDTTSQVVQSHYHFEENHVYFLFFDIKANSSGHNFGASLSGASINNNTILPFTEMPTVWTRLGGMRKFVPSGIYDEDIRIAVQNATSFSVNDGFELKNVICIDITKMFGSTIANYIYTLEQNNAGEGVAFFRSIYPEDYYAYDSGTTEIVGKETPEATIAFGQTVYGGVLDVTRGKLHVTWGRSDMGDLSYTKYDVSEGTLFRARIDEANLPANSLNIKSSIYQTTTSNNRVNYSISVGSAGRIDFINNDYSDKDVFKSAMAGIYVYYELATPFDIDLTPVQIRALVGTNNVFADCGETEVEYLKVE